METSPRRAPSWIRPACTPIVRFLSFPSYHSGWASLFWRSRRREPAKGQSREGRPKQMQNLGMLYFSLTPSWLKEVLEELWLMFVIYGIPAQLEQVSPLKWSVKNTLKLSSNFLFLWNARIGGGGGGQFNIIHFALKYWMIDDQTCTL